MEGFPDGLELVALVVTILTGVAKGITWFVKQQFKQKLKVRQALDEQDVRLIRARTTYQECQIAAGKATADDEGNYISLSKQSTNNEVEDTREEMENVIAEVATDGIRSELDQTNSQMQSSARDLVELGLIGEKE